MYSDNNIASYACQNTGKNKLRSFEWQGGLNVLFPEWNFVLGSFNDADLERHAWLSIV